MSTPTQPFPITSPESLMSALRALDISPMPRNIPFRITATPLSLAETRAELDLRLALAMQAGPDTTEVDNIRALRQAAETLISASQPPGAPHPASETPLHLHISISGRSKTGWPYISCYAQTPAGDEAGTPAQPEPTRRDDMTGLPNALQHPQPDLTALCTALAHGILESAMAEALDTPAPALEFSPALTRITAECEAFIHRELRLPNAGQQPPTDQP